MICCYFTYGTCENIYNELIESLFLLGMILVSILTDLSRKLTCLTMNSKFQYFDTIRAPPRTDASILAFRSTRALKS